jgi:hypothetical protein
MAYIRPTTNDFKTYFTRDFPFGATPDKVMDSDVARAQAEAALLVNEGLSPTRTCSTSRSTMPRPIIWR